MPGYTPSTDYPYIAKKSDPLTIRVDKLSLLVANSNFYAKVAKGYHFTGFYIYVSGLTTPIMTRSLPTQEQITVGGQTTTKDRKWTVESIEKEACKWLDDLETAIANSTNDSGIEGAINNLRWQLHYDITKTTTTIPTEISIDTASGVLTMKEMFNTLTDRLAPSGSTVYQSISAVATSLKDTTDTYTISRALRESSDGSVSSSIKEQTDLIDTEFSNVEDTLGNSSDTPSDGSLFGTLNRVDGQIGTDNSETVIQKLNGIDSSTSGVGTDLSVIKGRIGTNSDSDSGTLWYDVLHRAGTRSMPSGAQYQSDSPLGQVKSKTDSMYTGLLGENGALQLASGYDYLTNNSGGAFVENSGGNPAVSSKYYMRTESSRFALVYNISGGVSANYAALKSQPAANQNPW